MKTPKENLPTFHLRKVSLLSVLAEMWGPVSPCSFVLAGADNPLDETCVFVMILDTSGVSAD